MKKLFTTFIFIGFICLIIPGQVLAQTDVGISFGIRPTKAFEDRPETFSYFHHILTPGQVLQDEALVMNDSDQPIVLKLYTADGISAQNGGTAFGKQGESINGVSAWLSPSEMQIELGAGEEATVPFTINVPPDTPPGHHVAGLVVEALPTEGQVDAGESEAQFVVSVVRRVGIAVVIEVPGPQTPALEVTSAYLSEQSEMGATFAVEVHNPGNVFLQSEGALEVYTSEGVGLVSIPLDFDTVLPGDTAVFWVTSPIRLADSDYSLIVRLNYPGGSSLYEEATAFVREGQPVVEDTAPRAPQSPSIAEIVPVEDSQTDNNDSSAPNRLWIWITLSLSIVTGSLLVIIVIQRKRMKTQKRVRAEISDHEAS